MTKLSEPYRSRAMARARWFFHHDRAYFVAVMSLCWDRIARDGLEFAIEHTHYFWTHN